MEVSEPKGLQKALEKVKKQLILAFFFHLMPYSIIQHYLTKNDKHIYLKSILSVILSVPVVAVSTILVIILFVYKKLVDFILCCRLGPKYHGLITGPNQLITLYKTTCGTICIFFSIEEERPFEEFYGDARKKVNEILKSPDTNKTLLSTRERFMGHLYFKEATDMTPDEIFKEFTFGSEEEFIDKYFLLSESPLPRNNSYNWDITFCKSPKKLLGENKKSYKILFRLHHSVGDGLAFYHILYKIWVKRDLSLPNYASKLLSGAHKHKQSMSFSLKLKNILSTVNKPQHILFNPNCNRDGICAIKCETEGKYIEKIKFIKNRIHEASFYNIVMCAVSASLTDFFIKHESGNKIPEQILLMTPLQVDLDRVGKLFQFDSNAELGNDFTMCPFNIPIVPKKFVDEKIEDYLRERLFLIKTEFDDLKSSFDMRIIYTFFNVILGVLPNVLATKTPSTFYSGAVSHIPGGPQVQTTFGSKIANITFVIPKLPEYGFGLSFLTYDDRLTFGISAGKSEFTSRKELNEILENIFKYIDIMYKQVV